MKKRFAALLSWTVAFSSTLWTGLIYWNFLVVFHTCINQNWPCFAFDKGDRCPYFIWEDKGKEHWINFYFWQLHGQIPLALLDILSVFHFGTGVPNLWAPAHYRALATWPPGCVKGWPVHSHTCMHSPPHTCTSATLPLSIPPALALSHPPSVPLALLPPHPRVSRQC